MSADVVMEFKIPAKVRRKIGRAMHDYRMFADGDRILVAVSGGVDSLVLAGLLAVWRQRAPIDYTLDCIHIDHGCNDTPPEKAIAPQLARFGLSVTILSEGDHADMRSCFLCARSRRNQLFDQAQLLGCNRIAFGHHRDDLVETFLLNAFYSGSLSTMVPKQELFQGSLALVRPMAYLEKADIRALAAAWQLRPVTSLCPSADNTRRQRVRDLLATLYADEPQVGNSLFAALSNVRHDYLLTVKHEAAHQKNPQ